MRWLAAERRLRDALVDAVISRPGHGLVAPGTQDRRASWASFDDAAPVHLALALRAATLALGVVLPRALGHGASLDSLSGPAREQVLAYADALAALSPLVEVVKIVACLIYFDDDAVQAGVRGVAA